MNRQQLTLETICFIEKYVETAMQEWSLRTCKANKGEWGAMLSRIQFQLAQKAKENPVSYICPTRTNLQKLARNCKNSWLSLHLPPVKEDEKKLRWPLRTFGPGAIVDTIFRGTSPRSRRSLARMVDSLAKCQTTATRQLTETYAAVANIKEPSAARQLYRLLHESSEVWERRFPFDQWIKYIVKDPTRPLYCALDWTDYDSSNQTTLVISIMLGAKRSIPLIWQTHTKGELTGGRVKAIESLLQALRSAIPCPTPIFVVADREFGTNHLYEFCSSLSISYLFRAKANTKMQKTGSTLWRSAREWFRAKRSAAPLDVRTVLVARSNPFLAPRVVVTKDAGMKEMWTLVTNITNLSAAEVIRLYACRWSIEWTFRDTKSPLFGIGFSGNWYYGPNKNMARDRMWLLIAIVFVFWTGMGAAGDLLSLDLPVRVKQKRKPPKKLKRGEKPVKRKATAAKRSKRPVVEQTRSAQSLMTIGRKLVKRYFLQAAFGYPVHESKIALDLVAHRIVDNLAASLSIAWLRPL
jgi:hypothetical protein